MLMLCVQRKKYEQLGDDGDLATVRVLVPEKLMELWQLLWTIKRHRDPDGRRSSFPADNFLLNERVLDKILGQFHSVTTIDPIEHQTHLELDTNRESILVALYLWY